MAALMTCDKDKNENVVKFIAEARGSGIEVLPPCVNESQADFSVVQREGNQLIRFGLAAVRNVGAGAVESILAARREGGAFASMYETCAVTTFHPSGKRTQVWLWRPI